MIRTDRRAASPAPPPNPTSGAEYPAVLKWAVNAETDIPSSPQISTQRSTRVRPLPDGPRSLPSRPRHLSYSSIALAALDSASETRSHSHSHSHSHPAPDRDRPRTRPAPPLKRSDSLLNRARRVFSLPPYLKRRALVPETSAPSAPPPPRTTTYDQATVRALESELEAERVRSERYRQKMERLEEETLLSRHALPAVEDILKAALAQFEAKEHALRDTIRKMDHEYHVVLREKNEAVRLLNTFVARARSPPASFSSSLSEKSAFLSVGGQGVPVAVGRKKAWGDAYRRDRVVGVLNDPKGVGVGPNYRPPTPLRKSPAS